MESLLQVQTELRWKKSAVGNPDKLTAKDSYLSQFNESNAG
jgi:hypothetical protein